MEDLELVAVDLRVAYHRKPGESALERLAPDPGVDLEVLRGRISPRHARLLVRLRGGSRSIRSTLDHLSGHAVSFRRVRL